MSITVSNINQDQQLLRLIHHTDTALNSDLDLTVTVSQLFEHCDKLVFISISKNAICKNSIKST